MATAALAATWMAGGRRAGAQPARRFINATSGGASEEAATEAVYIPFTRRTGIQIEVITPTSLGRLRAMVTSGNVTASLWDVNSKTYEQAVSLGLLEKINWDHVNPLPMWPETRREYGFGQSYFSTGMAWRDGTRPISTWADFWNVEQFPGRRCLADRPDIVLPVALMADGVPMDKVYPLDIDRAFRAVERIKRNVSVWWTTGSQPAQLLADGEVAYAVAWNGRIMSRPGLTFNYNQALLDIAFLVVPRGAPPREVEAAMLLLHDWTDPAKQAVYASRVFYSGNSPDLVNHLPDALKDKLPTSPQNKERQLLSDGNWWFVNGESVEQRWQEWKLSR
jgi:putative spermidine/putrescine transport system substrate-binding protein